MELKGSQTEKNLLEAFAGESKARNKYTYFASVAKKEGYIKFSNLFLETAGNEKEHAELWFKALGLVGDTAANLEDAAEGEHYEWTTMYKDFAEIAHKEGFHGIAMQMEKVAEVEKTHEARYRKMLERLNKNEVFISDEVSIWKCTNCGYISVGKQAPAVCPACKHPQSYFVRVDSANNELV